MTDEEEWAAIQELAYKFGAELKDGGERVTILYGILNDVRVVGKRGVERQINDLNEILEGGLRSLRRHR